MSIGFSQVKQTRQDYKVSSTTQTPHNYRYLLSAEAGNGISRKKKNIKKYSGEQFDTASREKKRNRTTTTTNKEIQTG